ncbi:hypothetical protein [Oryza sativa Japonica Group]|uniref:Uncharacterized protein OJ1656_A11.28 n=1 Tax=Oryza sativa subsp. japonica TaxID=39947 RepID=Q5JLF7_ORYSJ|nr:hypothetical protein [Oryza sativa Japonica Group]
MFACKQINPNAGQLHRGWEGKEVGGYQLVAAQEHTVTREGGRGCRKNVAAEGKAGAGEGELLRV